MKLESEITNLAINSKMTNNEEVQSDKRFLIQVCANSNTISLLLLIMTEKVIMKLSESEEEDKNDQFN